MTVSPGALNQVSAPRRSPIRLMRCLQPPCRRHQPPPRRQIALRSLRIRDLHIRWSNGATENSADWDFPRLDAEAEDIGHSMLMTGNGVSGGRPLTISGELGALDRLLDASDERPWTLDVTARTEGFQIQTRGTVLHPLRT